MTWRITEAQVGRVQELARSSCSNCLDGNCLLLDDGEACVCPQLISYTLLCKYFRAAVLPADRELYADIMDADARKRCAECGRPFAAESKNARYCKTCAANRTRRKKREWAGKNRGRP